MGLSKHAPNTLGRESLNETRFAKSTCETGTVVLGVDQYSLLQLIIKEKFEERSGEAHYHSKIRISEWRGIH